MQTVDVLAIVWLGAWLIVETAWDIKKTREIPLLLILPQLIGGVVYLIYAQHYWAAAGLVTGVAASNANKLLYRFLGSMVLFAGTYFDGVEALGVAWLIFWFAWEINIYGGADALASIAIMSVFPEWPYLVLLGAGIGLYGVAAILIRMRGRSFEAIKMAVLRLRTKVYLSEEEMDKKGVPAMGSVLLGFALVVLFGFFYV
jgi:hypothetical protein